MRFKYLIFRRRLKNVSVIKLFLILIIIIYICKIILLFIPNHSFKVNVKYKYTSINLVKNEISEKILSTSWVQSLRKTNDLFNTFENKLPVLNCREIIAGNEQLILRAEQQQFEKIKDSKLIDITKNCTSFLQNRKYYSNPLSNEEKDFPLAFTISVYKNADQVERLLRSIYWNHNYYCIHIDKKASSIFKNAIKNLVKCFDNIILSSKFVEIIYPGISIVQAELNCMKDLISRFSKWKYLINLTGEEFPLKTNRELVQILKFFNGVNDIQARYWPSLIKRRTEFSYKVIYNNVTKNHEIIQTSQRKTLPPHNLTIYKGSKYGTFSRSFVHFILKNKVSLALYDWLKDTLSPDESYWGTLIANVHLQAPGGWNGSKTLFASKRIIWKYDIEGRENTNCRSNKFIRSVCIFGLKDLYDLSQRPHFFANKFNNNFQPMVLQCLEELIYNRTMGLSFTRLNEQLYKNISSIDLYNDAYLQSYFEK